MSKRKRFSPDESNTPGMRLNPCKLEIIRAVHGFRFLTTEQVCRLKFSPSTKSYCLKTLRQLFDHGYLDRFPLVPGVPMGKLVYRLGREGARLLAQEQGARLKAFHYWGKSHDRHHIGQTEITVPFLHHELKINDIRIAVIQAAQQSGYTLTQWTDSSVLKSAEMKDYVSIERKKGRLERRAVIPDAYFTWRGGVKPGHFFLEVDYGTEAHKDWKAKIAAYIAYTRPPAHGPSQYEKRYQTTTLRILTVAPSEGRLRNLLRTTEAETKEKFFWFTTFAEIAQNNFITAPIWLQANTAPEQSRKPLVVSPPTSKKLPDGL